MCVDEVRCWNEERKKWVNFFYAVSVQVFFLLAQIESACYRICKKLNVYMQVANKALLSISLWKQLLLPNKVFTNFRSCFNCICNVLMVHVFFVHISSPWNVGHRQWLMGRFCGQHLEAIEHSGTIPDCVETRLSSPHGPLINIPEWKQVSCAGMWGKKTKKTKETLFGVQW